MVQKHFYNFGNDTQKKIKGRALNEENWDILRNDDVDGPFSIEKNIEAYEANCRKEIFYEGVARIIISELNRNESKNKIISLGIGKGILEWHLKNLKPSLWIECTDYAALAIERLKTVFPSMDVGYTFDILNGDYGSLGTDSILLMFRVSTEFNRNQWHGIFKRMHDSGIKRIIYVPAGLDTEQDMYYEKINHLKRILRGKRDIFCGWLYSEDEFESMFRGDEETPLYDIDNRIPFENTAVYFLKIHELL